MKSRAGLGRVSLPTRVSGISSVTASSFRDLAYQSINGDSGTVDGEPVLVACLGWACVYAGCGFAE